MAKSDKNDVDKKADGKEKGGKKKLLAMMAVFVVVAGGAYFMFGKGCDTACEAEAAELAENPPEGPIVLMEPISINLQNDHFLKVVPALQLVEGSDPALYEDGLSAKASDLIIESLGGQQMEVLATGEGRKTAKAELRKKLDSIFEGDVIDIYFTEFVMQ